LEKSVCSSGNKEYFRPSNMRAYLTWRPGARTTDADRNCISNIRPGGMGYADAVFSLVQMLRTMRAKRLSGVKLKDESDRLLIGAP
jgi:ethanolamine ammonia-lyase small subunit